MYDLICLVFCTTFGVLQCTTFDLSGVLQCTTFDLSGVLQCTTFDWCLVWCSSMYDDF